MYNVILKFNKKIWKKNYSLSENKNILHQDCNQIENYILRFNYLISVLNLIVFLQALWLTKPWYVKEFKLDTEKERLDIYLDFEKWSKFVNTDWDEVTAYQTVNKTWKHLFFWQYPTYIHARVPKLKDKNWKVKMIKLSWAREWSWFTFLFESMCLELMKHMPLSKLWEYLQEDWERLMRIAKYYVNKSKEKADYSNISRWWIDETSRKKWHNYLTTFINFDTRKVSCIVEWKWAETVKKIVKDIEKHWWKKENIKEVSIDFWPAFIAWVKQYMPNATIVYDRFHFMQFVNKALDEVRRKEARANKILKKSRYLWLKDPDDLKESSRQKLEELKRENKVLAEAYQMKENIKEFFEKESKEEAKEFLRIWCEWVNWSNIEPMKKVVQTIRTYWDWLINYIDLKINNQVVEWINWIIQTIKRRARWYRNFENFKIMIYLKIWDFEINVN